MEKSSEVDLNVHVGLCKLGSLPVCMVHQLACTKVAEVKKYYNLVCLVYLYLKSCSPKAEVQSSPCMYIESGVGLTLYF